MSTRFRLDIEGLRAIAILLVVATHASVPWLAGGFVGVDVFFVLSGFLITSKLVQEVEATGHLQLLPFYVRRLRRLLPALLLMLLSTGIVSSWLLSPGETAEQSFAAQMAAIWFSNFHFALRNLDYFSAGNEANLYLHTWSLGVEEQFYLLWPALILWLLMRGSKFNVARLKHGLLIIMLISGLSCIALTYIAPLLAFYMMPLRAWQFAAGALVWLVFARTSHPTSKFARMSPALGYAGLLLILLSALWLDTNHAYPGPWASIPTAGAALVILAGCGASDPHGVHRLLSLPPLQWLGRISYAWYLWHWPILLLGTALTDSPSPAYKTLLVAISLALAALSHALVEAPLRRWKLWLAYPHVAMLTSLSCMLLFGLIANHWMQQANQALQSPQIQRYIAARSDAPIIYRMGCDDWYRSSTVRICSFGDAHAKHTAVLIGDSHVGQWFPAVQIALAHQDWRLLVITKSSCPMVDVPLFYARIGREYTECSQWREEALQRIAEISPELLLLGSAQYAFTPDQWREGTRRILARVSPHSRHVFLLQDIPELPFDGPACLIHRTMRPKWLAEFSQCVATAQSSRHSAIRSWLEAAMVDFPNVTWLDMTPYVCPEQRCRAELNGHITYRDNQHLTASFAESLGMSMKKAIIAPDGSVSTDRPGKAIATNPAGTRFELNETKELPAIRTGRDKDKLTAKAEL